MKRKGKPKIGPKMPVIVREGERRFEENDYVVLIDLKWKRLEMERKINRPPWMETWTKGVGLERKFG